MNDSNQSSQTSFNSIIVSDIPGYKLFCIPITSPTTFLDMIINNSIKVYSYDIPGYKVLCIPDTEGKEKKLTENNLGKN